MHADANLRQVGNTNQDPENSLGCLSTIVNWKQFQFFSVSGRIVNNDLQQ